MQAPPKIIELYQQIQVDNDMDSGTYIGGTAVYQADLVIKEIAKLAGWELPPRMKLAEREAWLRARNRADEIEYLGVNGD